MKRQQNIVSGLKKDMVSHARAIRLLLTCSRQWAVMGITIVMDAVYPFISIYLSAMLLDALYEGRSLRQMILFALLGAGAALLVTLTRHWVAKRKNTLWWTMHFRIAEPVMEKTMKMDYELTEDAEVQRMRNRQNDYEKRGTGIFEIFLRQLEILLTAVLKLIFALITMWPVIAGLGTERRPLLPALLTAAVFAAGLFLEQRTVSRETLRRQRLHSQNSDRYRLNSYIMEKVILDTEAGKDIRLFHQEEMLSSYGHEMIFNWRATAKKLAASHIRQDSFQSLFASGTGGIIYLYTGLRSYAGSIAPGSVVKYAGGIQQMIQSVTDIMLSWSYLHRNCSMMDEYLDYLALPEVKKKGTIPVQKRRDGKFLLEFRNVSFRYPGTEQYALKNMNVRLEIGERVALVGPNGSGKTTFVKLLTRLYDPTEGEILLNDVDIRKYRYEEYMKLFSVVFQDFQIFSFAAGEYIASGTRVDRRRAMDAVRRAGLTELIGRMPDGLDTPLGRDFSDEGFEISGGEAQKIAMARAIYKNAPFVILDEPTAALDPVAENEIYTGFHEIIGNKTALFISHRLSACRFAKEILVFENGGVIQRGSHEQLSGKPGLYRRMWEAQAKYYQ